VPSSPRITTELTLRRIAATQRDLFTYRQATDHGWSRQRLHRWLGAGRILRIHPRVYRFAGSPSDWLTDLLAAVRAAGEGAVASHRSGMAMHIIEPAFRDHPTPIEVSIPASRDAKVRGAIVHRVALPGSDVTVVDGIPCTAYERTLLDKRRSPPSTRWSLVSGQRAGVDALVFASSLASGRRRVTEPTADPRSRCLLPSVPQASRIRCRSSGSRSTASTSRSTRRTPTCESASSTSVGIRTVRSSSSMRITGAIAC
jgi:hypothetical protein